MCHEKKISTINSQGTNITDLRLKIILNDYFIKIIMERYHAYPTLVVLTPVDVVVLCLGLFDTIRPFVEESS